VQRAIVRTSWQSSLERVSVAVWSPTIDWQSVEAVMLATSDTSWSEVAWVISMIDRVGAAAVVA
jgi:hypothetical protein